MEQMQIPVGSFVFDALAEGPGDGELVLLLHGFPQSSHEWRHQLGALADAGYRVVAPDQRGYSPGACPQDPAEYTAADLVGDVLGIADQLGAERFHLVGHDWGGTIGWQIAGRHPERLASLAVISTPHPAAMRRSIRGGGEQKERSSYMLFFRSPEAEETLLADDAALLRSIFTTTGLSEEAVNPYVERMQRPGMLTGGLNWYRTMGVDLVEGLGPITTPTLYVWSTDDAALGRETAEATARYVDGPYRFEVIEGVEHWVPELVPELLGALLLDHLASATTAEPA